jgi:hypothetical protein
VVINEKQPLTKYSQILKKKMEKNKK